ncbi:MAG: YebC/PmpR family DNA-binding transcriptional regulator [Clostridiales bacterium]|nr:YebC/PmpR family DNA-binding transcriptional regulator [Clostridiales bacterium]MBQ2818638.1 YebC/PmpR family DNA-binding transcriptional regulator [Clostridia bacterium]
MSGHSHAANIAGKKSKTDAAKSKIYTKLGREISVAVREGGGDPVSNQKLRDVIAKCRAANMPNDNIWRSIRKAAGEGESVDYVANLYEGYAPGGVAVMVDTLTENKNRTVSDVRHAFDKHGGSMGASGCVSYMFDRKGVIVIAQGDLDEDEFMMTALDAGADDVELNEGYFEITTDPNNFSAVREELEKQGLTFESAEVSYVAQNYIEVSDEETVTKIKKLIAMLEDLDDVQEVYHNAELPVDDEE